MKKYILIQNDGEIETNSFELIGASTKRGETGKIGFFGSGLKYSIAYMMRNGIDFKIFSGEKELVFSTVSEDLRDKSFDRICINGKQTSYTTTMGPTWTEDWFVLREVYCNALDEGTCQLIKETDIVQPSVGKTRIFIERTGKLVEMINNWDRYFTDERSPLFTAEKIYTSYIGDEDGQPSSRYQKIKCFHKTDGAIFRKGVRVGESKDLAYDYELQFVNINEDRTAKSLSAIEYFISDMFGQFPNEDWVKSILRTSQDEKPAYEYRLMNQNYIDQPPSEKWIEFSKKHLLVVKEISGRFEEDIVAYKGEVFLIPSIFARSLKKKLPEMSILGMGEVIGDAYMQEVEKTKKMEFLLKEVTKSLEEMNYPVHYPITVVEFDRDNILGKADVAAKKIYLSRQLFDKGRREIAMTLMEEVEHILSGKGDKTREFQTHIFSQWLKTMENSNGLFL